MKKIISGKVYNTETAVELAEYSTPDSVTDFRHYNESLYRKKTGEYFLHGEGGPASKYAVAEYGGWSNGEGITPLTYDSARQWAEQHLDVETYEDIFGEVEEDDSRQTVAISISSSVAEKGKRLASQRGCSFSALVESLLEKEI